MLRCSPPKHLCTFDLLVQAHTLGGTSDAACGRRLDVVEELFSRQCVREAALVPDRDGQTFLFYMADWGGFSHSRYVEFDTIVETAQELGVDINHQVGGSGAKWLPAYRH